MLTIKVYRVREDGTRTRLLRDITVIGPRNTTPLPLSIGYPPCRCPRCRSQAPGRTGPGPEERRRRPE
ncbi:hypothetical protein [Streptomyces daliensis]|uniref:Uncharacterized protein n=1 Tax=Streptomyces daliensis TaxID=299421 RepID=A0A8T4IJH5_9ACTN|nr:hypothetical protein [Streptomyces daliensis]